MLMVEKSHYLSLNMEGIGEGIAIDTANEDIPVLLEEVKATIYGLANCCVLGEECSDGV